MSEQGALGALASALLRGEVPDEVALIKDSPVRAVVRAGEVALKVLRRAGQTTSREVRALERARALCVPVPEVVAHGERWLATRWLDARPAARSDLPAILAVVARMHAQGMLHRDLHLGNILVGPGGPILLDVQKARFLPGMRIPRWFVRWEIGYLAYSLGDPLPESLAHARYFRDRRAHTHWRSRTRRCLVESSGFTAVAIDGACGFRRRALGESQLARLLRDAPSLPATKDSARTRLVHADGLVLKRHATPRDARDAWISGCGLEARGIETGRPVAWVGPWLVMEDAGPTLSDWVDRAFVAASDAEREALADMAGELLARLHARGIYHPDLKANNVCWAPGRAPRLVDFGRVRFKARRVSRRRRLKNLAQLNAALPDVVTGSLRARSLARYLEVHPEPDGGAALRRAVILESLRRRHRFTGC